MKSVHEGYNGFHIILLSGGDAARIFEPFVELMKMDRSDAQIESTSMPVADESGDGGMVVTSDDPTELRKKYTALGFRTCVVSVPRKRPHENAHMVSMDLRLTGEYREMRRDFLP